MTVICSFRLSKPLRIADVARPISRRSRELVLSRAMASISSNRTRIFSGCAKWFSSSNSAAMFFCVWPSLLSMMVSKSTQNRSRSRMRAICRTDSVLPVPGAPWNRNLLIPMFRWMALMIPIMSFSMGVGSGSESCEGATLRKKVIWSSCICGTKAFALDIRAMMYSES